MNKNKFLSLGMVLVMLVTMMMGSVPSAAVNVESYRVGDYEFNSDGMLTKYYGTSPEVVIPSTLTSGSAITITSIAPNAFNGPNKDTVRSLWIPNTVTSIAPFSFTNCSNLGPNLTLPKSVKEIGDRAFAGTKIQAVTFEGDAPTMGAGVFDSPSPNPNFKMYYLHGSKGFGTTIGGYPCSEKTYRIDVWETEHGTITTTASALEGDLVKLQIQPEPGYSVGEIECESRMDEGRGVTITGDSFVMPGSDVFIRTKFGYAVKANPVANGSVAGLSPVESEGNRVSVMSYPNPGYRIKAGSLKYTFNGQSTLISKNMFIMPKGEVTLSCEFEPSPYKWDKQTLNSANKASLVCTDPAGNLYVLVQTSTRGKAPAVLELHKRQNGVWSKTDIALTRGVDRIMQMVADSSGRVYMAEKSDDIYTYTPGQSGLEKIDFGKDVSVMSITVDASDNLYVADGESTSILKRAKGSTLWTTVSTNTLMGKVDFLAIAVDADGTQYLCYVGDDMNVLKKSPSSSTWETITPNELRFGIGLTVAGNGTLYIVDPYTAVIHKLEKGATVWSKVDMGGYAQVPFSIACDGNGQLAIISNNFASVESGGDLYTLATNCTVTFDYNGGLGSSSKVVPAGSALGALPSLPTRSSYTFDGWNTNKEGTGAAVTENTSIVANTVVYAKWKAVTTSGGTSGGGGASNGGSGASTAPATPAKPVTITPPITPAAPVNQVPSLTPAKPAPAAPAVTPTAPAAAPAPFKAKLNKEGVAAVQVEVKDLRDDLEQAVKTKKKELSLGIESPKGARSVETELSKEVLKATKENGIKRLALNTSLGNVSFNELGLKSLQKSTNEDVLVSFEKKQVNGNEVYDIKILSGGKVVKGLVGNVEVSMPYKLGKGETPKSFKLYVADDKGKPVLVKGAVYDEKTKRVKFKR